MHIAKWTCIRLHGLICTKREWKPLAVHGNNWSSFCVDSVYGERHSVLTQCTGISDKPKGNLIWKRIFFRFSNFHSRMLSQHTWKWPWRIHWANADLSFPDAESTRNDTQLALSQRGITFPDAESMRNDIQLTLSQRGITFPWCWVNAEWHTVQLTLRQCGFTLPWCWVNAERHPTYAEPTRHYVPPMLSQRGMTTVQLSLSQRRIMFPYVDTTRIDLSLW